MGYFSGLFFFYHTAQLKGIHALVHVEIKPTVLINVYMHMTYIISWTINLWNTTVHILLYGGFV